MKIIHTLAIIALVLLAGCANKSATTFEGAEKLPPEVAVSFLNSLGEFYDTSSLRGKVITTKHEDDTPFYIKTLYDIQKIPSKGINTCQFGKKNTDLMMRKSRTNLGSSSETNITFLQKGLINNKKISFTIHAPKTLNNYSEYYRILLANHDLIDANGNKTNSFFNNDLLWYDCLIALPPSIVTKPKISKIGGALISLGIINKGFYE